MERIKNYILNRLYNSEIRDDSFNMGFIYNILVILYFGSVSNMITSDLEDLHGFKHKLKVMYEDRKLSFFIMNRILKIDIFQKELSDSDKLVFYQSYLEFVDMGKNETDFLKFVANINYINPEFRYVIKSMHKEIIDSHKNFSTIMEENKVILGEAYINFILKTLSSGKVDEALSSIIDELKFKRDLGEQLIKQEASFKFNVIFTHVINIFLLGYTNSLLFKSFNEQMREPLLTKILIWISDLFTNPIFMVGSTLLLVVFMVVMPIFFGRSFITDIRNMKMYKLSEPYRYFYNTSFFIALELFTKYSDSTEHQLIKNSIHSVDNKYYQYIMETKLENTDRNSGEVFKYFFKDLKLLSNERLYRLENAEAHSFIGKITEAKEYYLGRRDEIVEAIPEAYSAMNQAYMTVNTLVITLINLYVTLRLNDLADYF